MLKYSNIFICASVKQQNEYVPLNNFPQHKLRLKLGVPIMVLRNIDPLNGVCNGTQGIVTRLMDHLVEVEIQCSNDVNFLSFPAFV